MIPYAKQNISEADIEAVANVLCSDFITQGPVVQEFEQAIADYCNVNYALAVSSGTAALHLACLALGVTEGDRVWTSPNTFVATANCALYCGAEIDFVDIDIQTYNMSVSALEEKLIQAQQNNTLPKVVIPVHFAGQSCDMQAINKLSQCYGFKIIEDAAHALGGYYQNDKVGSCQYSDISIFSLHPAKMITTGEGGLLVTNNQSLFKKASLLRTHGVTRDPSLMEGESHGLWYYQQVALGYNFRITDIQAALGLSQLKRLDSFVERRQELAVYYHQQLQALPVVLPLQYKQAQSSWHLYVIQLNLNDINITRKDIFDQLRQKDIGVHIHYIPVHTQPYYKNMGFKTGDFPQAEHYYQQAITLPLFVDLQKKQIDYIASSLKSLLL